MPRVLLLQGPIGPFFRDLQAALEEAGAQVTRVLLNAGDVLFAPDHDTVRFTGTRDDWRTWLAAHLDAHRPDTIIMFGGKRPAHAIARALGQERGIEILSLEEGYLRSGYVTCEKNGNNDMSPICGLVPPTPERQASSDTALPLAPAPANVGSGFRIMNWWGFLYFTTRILFSPRSDAALIHRPLKGPVAEGLFWLRNIVRLASKRLSERRAIRKLVKAHDGDYFLVPLQMPSDSQMGAAARGWNIERLVDATMRAFSATRTVSKIVFKLHPLDGHAFARERMIVEKAQTYGLRDHVSVLHSGSIAEVSTHSAGMILINSTSGMTAIHHGTPLLVMGEAVFRHPTLVHCGEDDADIEAFMTKRWSAPAEQRRAFEQFVAREALVPGDFYKKAGRKIAAREISRKVLEASASSRSADPAPGDADEGRQAS